MTILLGLGYAALCEFIAFGIAGAGHGWITPLFVGLSGFVLFPLCFWRTFAAPAYFPAWAEWMIIALAVGANLSLLGQTLNEGIEYFWKTGPFGHFWLLLWILGQAPLAYAWLKRFSAQQD